MTDGRKVSFAGVELPGAKLEGDLLEAGGAHVPVSGGGAGTVTVTTIQVDHRTEADGQVAAAFRIVCDARGEHDEEDGEAPRDYTSDELKDLFFSLCMAIIQLKKLPGGRKAHDHDVAAMRAELASRRRHDLLAKIDAEERSRRGNHRRVQRTVVVPYAELTETERYVVDRHPELSREVVEGSWEVLRWEDTEAVKIVKRTFGDDVDVSDGTVGDTYVKLVTAEMSQLADLRDQLLKLASTLRPEDDTLRTLDRRLEAAQQVIAQLASGDAEMLARVKEHGVGGAVFIEVDKISALRSSEGT